MYHRVVDKVFDPRQLCVSRVHFGEHMQVIKKYGSSVRMREMGRKLNRFPSGGKGIVVTLDDGYGDNFHNAKPVLERYEIPATLFIVTGSIGSPDGFWWNNLEPTILAPQKLPEVFETIFSGKKYRWNISPGGPCRTMDYSQWTQDLPQNDLMLSRSGLYCVLMRLLAAASSQERKDMLGQIDDWAGHPLTPKPDSHPMTYEEIFRLVHSPLFEIGAHTVNHIMLSLLPPEKQEEEINSSKCDLENMIDCPVTSFSYPYGNYTDETVRLVERLKFQYACTTVSKPVTRNTSPYLLPRFAVGNWDGEQFEKNLRTWLA
jgi:peptidoglycan/xylan/chitin deacetylase (PgdA/CDA1 family)